MVHLPGGTFTMGSDEEDLALQCPGYPRGCPDESKNEIPRHSVTVAPFELDRREVTNQEFAAFLNAIGSSLRVVEDPDDHYDRYVQYFLHGQDVFLLYDLWPGTAGIRYDRSNGSKPYSVRTEFEQLPVTQVSWLGARLFCRNAVKRLPSEAEWEFAASGLRRRPYPWGSAAPNCDGVHIASNGYLTLLNPSHCDNKREVPYPVLSAPQDVTPEGVADLAGNVAEWVDADTNVNGDETAYAARLASERPEVFRGAAFDMSFMTRATARNFRLAFNVGDNIGFRCAKPLNISH
jgi:formylglycine-generating enzyme required for sulfatase activity